MIELPLIVEMTVDASPTEYSLTVEDNTETIELINDTVIEVGGGGHLPTYEGPYTVNAGLSAVTLETNGMKMTDNVTVNALTENTLSDINLSVNTSNGEVTADVSLSPGYNEMGKGKIETLALPTQSAKTVTPTTSEQTAVARGKYTTGAVKVRAIPTGTRGTPTATKGTVSNHSVSVTPSVTNTTGYITGGTVTGTAVSVSASELVSGNKAITSNGNNIDVANYSTVSVNVPNPSTGTLNITANDTYDVTNYASAVVNVPTGTTPTGTISISANGTYDVTNYASADVNVSGGNPTAEDNDVIFIDYDGTIRYSYTAREFANLSVLPSNPTHSGLTAQGWNWELADAKTFVSTYGSLVIGQHYITDDGKTRLYIQIPEGTPSSEMTTYVRFKSSTSNNTTIDWGDGTTETKGSTTATNYSHTYANTGKYLITLTVNSGTITFIGSSGSNGNSIYGARINAGYTYNKYRLYKMELGSNTSIEDYAFYQTRGLETITIPVNYSIKGGEVFSYCMGLLATVYPHNSTITNYQNNSINYIAFPKSPNATASTGGNFSENQRLKKATYTAPRVVYTDNYLLKSVVIDNNATAIPEKAFDYCHLLTKIVFPAGITSIGANAFRYCDLMREYHFKSTTPPTLSNTNAFTGIRSNCKIYVPSASLNTYKTTTNWSTYANYMEGE